MNPNEYSNLAEVETRHWFYVGKREIVRRWIQRLRPLDANDLLADCGAGTGIFAAGYMSTCRVVAIDDHEESLALASQRLGSARVMRGACTNLPLADRSVDVLTALDVIEHVEDDRNALMEFSRVVKPGGLVVITVPALTWLWSDWDLALHHFRRYSWRALLDLVPREHFDIVHSAYINVAALPLVMLARASRALMRAFGTTPRTRLEDRIPPAPINAALKSSFVFLACQRLIRFPAGVGLLAVLRRK
jgi:ubiquinone/menaquinone biosynthesis C-methylase UbiE